MVPLLRLLVLVASVAVSVAPLPALAQQMSRLQCTFTFPGKESLSFEFTFDEPSNRATVLDLSRDGALSLTVNATFTTDVIQIFSESKQIAFVINRRDFRGAMVDMSQDEAAYSTCEQIPEQVPIPIQVPREQPILTGPCYSGYCPCDRSDPDFGGIDVPLCTMIRRGQRPSNEQVMLGEMARDARKQIRQAGY